MNKLIISHGSLFLLYALAQGVLFKDLVVFQVAFCYPYIAFILFFPVTSNSVARISIAFALGLTIDMFYDSLGMHASVAVFIAFFRDFWIQRMASQGGGESKKKIIISNTSQLLIYTFPLIFAHHTVLFFLEAGGFEWIGYTLLKIVASSIFTLLTVLLIRYLFFLNKSYG